MNNPWFQKEDTSFGFTVVYVTDCLGQPRDTNLKPRVHVGIVAHRNARMCCFINPGLEFTLNVIYEQKQDCRLLTRWASPRICSSPLASFSLSINWEDGTLCPFLFRPTSGFSLINRIKQASLKTLTSSTWMYISRPIKKNRMFSGLLLP